MEERNEKTVRLEQEIEKKKKYRMHLDANWNWQKKKLGCIIRPENANPAKDTLREVFAELAGVDLNELLNEMKSVRKKKEQTNKVLIDHEGDKNFKEVLVRSQVLGATQLTLAALDSSDEAKVNVTNNVMAQFAIVPKSPPKRVILELQRERAKPLRLPEQDQNKAATDRLEKKLAKQRAARMAAMEQSAKDEEALNATNELATTLDPASVLSKYEGDLFSTGGAYLDGMLYLSRMADSSLKLQRINTAMSEAEKKAEDKKAIDDIKKSEKEKYHDELEDKSSVEESSINQDTNSKLHCAASLCNWSRNPSNAHRLANEGAVRAINQLAMESLPRITMYCAAAYRHMSEHVVLANAMIDEIKTISTISEMVSSTSDDFIANNLAIALVNLTRVNGKEGAVVDAAIVLALMNLIMMKPELGATCVRGLYNLTCVDVTYTSIERVIRALVSLSLSGTGNVKHLCAAALCNLSDLKSVRARLVEEGAINVLSSLSRGAETRTRRVCAVILQNLSAARSVRVEMASRNSVAAAYALSSDQDPIILRCIGLTLSRLAMEPINCQRIIHESGVAALGSIAVKYPIIPGISQPVASAFQVLSSNQSFRVNIVNEGSVTAIASLLRSSVDMFTLQHSLLALCNLLCEPENHLPIIQQGLILTLISMCDHDNDLIKDFCSLAFLNLSCAEDSRKHLVNAGAVVAIIAIATENSDATKKRCAATLCNLSYYSAGMIRMVQDGIIPSIVQLVLAKDILTVHYSCAALCRLCCTVDNSRLILESGAVPNLVQGSIEGDQTTKQFCGAVLSSLSFYESCRITLCEMGAIAALKGLAELNDDVTKQRCLVAFANLSCEVSVQVKMIDEGVVSIIAELANSYQEINYICCAKAICNLACNPDTKLKVASDGGVHALLMISMVQSVDRLTKLLCVLGLNNLLDPITIDFMLEEGLVGSIANLSKIGDSHISMLSAKIFNHLTQFPAAREKITERTAVLTTLFKLCDSATAETQVIAMRTTCNLVLDPHVRGASLSAGAYAPLEKGVELQDKFTVMQCLIALFSVSAEPEYMVMMAKSTIPSTLLHFAAQLTTTVEEYQLAVKILAMLTWGDRSRLFMQKTELAQQLIFLVEDNLKREAVQWIACIFRNIVVKYPSASELVKLGIHSSLLKLDDASDWSDTVKAHVSACIVSTLRTLTMEESCIADLAAPSTIAMIHRACLAVCDSLGADGTLSPSTGTCALDVQHRPSRNQTMYDIAALMYLFANNSSSSRLTVAVPASAQILNTLSNFPETTEELSCTLGLFLMDAKARQPFATKEIATVIAKLADSTPEEGPAHNLVLCIYALSRMSSCRGFLTAAPIHIDRVINRLSLMDSPKIKANCSRAYKNLNADINEAIEEGAVASLIAMSLEGKLKNQSSDEFAHPVVMAQEESTVDAPECLSEISSDPSDAQWFERVKVTKGGAAGKGPEPPEPPAMSVDGSSEYPAMAEELDSGEVEGKTKMAFAKMQVPSSVKDQHLLSDTDFMLNADRDEASLAADEAAATAANAAGVAAQLNDESASVGNTSDVAEKSLDSGPRPLARNSPAPMGRLSRSGSIRGKLGRGASSRGFAMSRSSSGRMLDTADNGTKSPMNITPRGLAAGLNSKASSAAGKRDSTSPESASPDSSQKALKTKKTLLKPIPQAQKDPVASMGEQAARLGLYA